MQFAAFAIQNRRKSSAWGDIVYHIMRLDMLVAL
ncbi:MAG: hypothetical protein ACI8TF_002792, partial [Paracoccaceae bacterium]